ncbi:MAG: hypothetical protein JW850_19750 [Thermoflexales bacterium]|nr:hypothetical protein [Thermoflexales bacterium]
MDNHNFLNQDILPPLWPWADLDAFLPSQLLSLWPRRPRGILVPSEIAGLWHLPLQVLPSMHLSPRLHKCLPPPKALTESGHLVGMHEYQGQALSDTSPRPASIWPSCPYRCESATCAKPSRM